MMARNTQLPQETFEDSDRRVAILIDGDNAQASLIEEILVEAGKYGNAHDPPRLRRLDHTEHEFVEGHPQHPRFFNLSSNSVTPSGRTPQTAP